MRDATSSIWILLRVSWECVLYVMHRVVCATMCREAVGAEIEKEGESGGEAMETVSNASFLSSDCWRGNWKFEKNIDQGCDLQTRNCECG